MGTQNGEGNPAPEDTSSPLLGYSPLASKYLMTECTFTLGFGRFVLFYFYKYWGCCKTLFFGSHHLYKMLEKLITI